MSFERVRKQIEAIPHKAMKFDKFNKRKKRKFGKTTHPCRSCNKNNGIIRSYGLLYCRQCFRETAEKLGFRKYS